jgi:streptomycin 3"-adenylyltransferase
VPVRAQVDRIAASSREIIGDDLVGVYLHGSLAMGCFNPARSDIDVLVVARRTLAAADRLRFARAMLDCSRQPCPVEISVLHAADLRPWRHPAPYQFHFGESWRQRFADALAAGAADLPLAEPRADDDLAAHITVARARGVALSSPPPAETLPDVPHADYLDAILDDFAWCREHAPAFGVYAVLNACRVLAAARERLVLSKREGGEWALAVLPDALRPIVVRALAIYRGDADDTPFDATECTLFVEHMAAQIERAASVSL